MTLCCIKGCKSNSRKKEPQLTFHRIPRSLETKKKWVENIGPSNWTPGPNAYVCSLHFEEHCINRTLDVARIKENCYPTIFPHVVIEHNMTKTQDELNTACPSKELPLQQPHCSTDLMNRKMGTPMTHNIQFGVSKTTLQQVYNTSIQKLKNRVTMHKNKVKRLKEKVNKQAKEIVNLQLQSILENLRHKLHQR